MTRSELNRRARKIRLLIVDVDGVLTDGRMILGSDRNQIKAFYVRDGFGLVLARRAGLKTAIITAEESAAVGFRARQLKINWVAQGVRNKLDSFQSCLSQLHLKPESAAYVGDDLLDLPVLKRVGLSVTVSDAPEDVKRHVHYVTHLPGGRGAVREVVELILKAQGQWAGILRRYLA